MAGGMTRSGKTQGAPVADFVRESLLGMYDTNRTWLGSFDPEIIEAGYVRSAVTVPEKAGNYFGNAFGGFLMSLVDVAGCAVPWTLGKYVVTQTVDVHFLKGVTVGERIYVEGRNVRTGRTSSVAEVRITGVSADDLRLIAVVSLHIVRDIKPEDAGQELTLPTIRK